MDLLYGAYHREPGGALHHVATGQRLVPGLIATDRVLFEYRDHETNLTFLVRLTNSRPEPASYFGADAVVDWNLRQHGWVKKDYGVWRRLTWFLLDALLVWLNEEGRPQRSVLVFGGWFNGSWFKRGRFFVSGSKPHIGADALAEDIPIATSSFGCGMATGRHNNVSSTLTIVVVVPIPTPGTATSVSENKGVRTALRNDVTRSCSVCREDR